jgi:predicted metal-dependent peptidase
MTTTIDLITQFKIALADYAPYLSPYIYALNPVEKPGLGTMAVDKYGRLYYDPEWCESLTVEQGAYVIHHEAAHLILRHCHRAPGIYGDNPTAMEHRKLNIAMDLVVWEFLIAIKDFAPENGITFDWMKERWPEIEPNMTIEQIYSIMSEQEQPDFPPDLPVPSNNDEKGDGENNQDVNVGMGEEVELTPEEKAEDNSDGDGKSETQEDGPKADGEGRGKGPEVKPEDRGSGDGKDKTEGVELIGGGSAADGQPRDYEDEPDPNWDAFTEDRLLEAVERKIEELEEDREWVAGHPGTIPGELKRLIKQRLHPAPNPWDVLRSTVARCIANHRGAPDYTYRRLNRRQQGVPEMPRLKGTQKYSPKAAVVVDTSGSMTMRCLAKALTVIKQGLRALGEVPVITCDVRVGLDVVMRSVHEDFEFVGGGGTDMRIPLAYAEDKYKPDVIVIVTDTYTPWPDKPMKGQLIVAATQDGNVPRWATKVRIPDAPEKESI